MSKPSTGVPPHPFVTDPDVPPDHLGRGACRAPGCHLMGQPGDAHHTMPDPIADGQQLAAGEKGGE